MRKKIKIILKFLALILLVYGINRVFYFLFPPKPPQGIDINKYIDNGKLRSIPISDNPFINFIYDNLFYIIFGGGIIILSIIILSFIYSLKQQRKVITAQNKKIIFSTVCGGYVGGDYATVPFIKLVLFDDNFMIASHLHKIIIPYHNVKNITLGKRNSFFVRLHKRFIPSLLGGLIAMVVNILFIVFLPFFKVPGIAWSLPNIFLNIKYYAGLAGIVLGGLFLGKINIYQSLTIQYINEQGVMKEVLLYPARIDQAVELLQDKMRNVALDQK